MFVNAIGAGGGGGSVGGGGGLKIPIKDEKTLRVKCEYRKFVYLV